MLACDPRHSAFVNVAKLPGASAGGTLPVNAGGVRRQYRIAGSAGAERWCGTSSLVISNARVAAPADKSAAAIIPTNKMSLDITATLSMVSLTAPHSKLPSSACFYKRYRIIRFTSFPSETVCSIARANNRHAII
jgi:hypothetical protein